MTTRPNLPPPIRLSQWLETQPALTVDDPHPSWDDVRAMTRHAQREVIRKLRAAGNWRKASELSYRWGL